MKICPSCNVTFDDSSRTVTVKFDENEERHIKCPGCGSWFFEDNYITEQPHERPTID